VTAVEERQIEQPGPEARAAVQRSLDWQDHSAQEKAGEDR
jgi:hypothetical protein